MLTTGVIARGAPRVYQPSFDSLEQAEPAPEWFKDAKFGICFHWGVYSVPAFGNEWYPRTMGIEGSTENSHHVETYGSITEWPNDHFITGDRDKKGNFVQFAPRLKSEDGLYRPEQGVDLAECSTGGTRWVGPTPASGRATL